MSPYSRSVQELDCPTRMFVASLCLTEADVALFRAHAPSRPVRVSRRTATRSELHRALSSDPAVASAVADLLDLRHAAVVGHVRARGQAELSDEVQDQSARASGEQLAGWAWALVTDPRPEIGQLARCLMGECYVRGMRHLAEPRVGDEASAPETARAFEERG